MLFPQVVLFPYTCCLHTLNLLDIRSLSNSYWQSPKLRKYHFHTLLNLKIRQIFAGLLNKPEDSILVRIDRSYEKTLTEDTVKNKIALLKKFIEDLYSGFEGTSRRILYGS